jgi:hypothetical protein
MDTNSQGDISSDSDILDGIIAVFCDQGEKENWEKHWAHYFFDGLSHSSITFELYENQVWILPIMCLSSQSNGHKKGCEPVSFGARDFFCQSLVEERQEPALPLSTTIRSPWPPREMSKSSEFELLPSFSCIGQS